MAAVNVGDKKRLEADWPTLRVVSQPFESDAVAWAVSAQAPNLLRELDRFLSIKQLTSLVNGERYGDLPEIQRQGVLRVITRNNAATFFLWRGEQMGFEYELLREFAKRHRLHVEVVIAPQHASLFEMLERGAGDIAGGVVADRRAAARARRGDDAPVQLRLRLPGGPSRRRHHPRVRGSRRARRDGAPE